MDKEEQAQRQSENAGRLARALWDYSLSTNKIKQLAVILNYMPDQLAIDMNDLFEELLRLRRVENKDNRY